MGDAIPSSYFNTILSQKEEKNMFKTKVFMTVIAVTLIFGGAAYAQTQDQLQDKTQDRLKVKTQDQLQDKTQDRLQDKTQDKIQDMDRVKQDTGSGFGSGSGMGHGSG